MEDTGKRPSQTATGCDFIRNKIRSGEWAVGDKLPSQAAWAAGVPGLTIKYGTLRSIYIILRTEKWIVGQQGEGVFVSKENPHAASTHKDTKAAKAASGAKRK
jgi:DNA-binding FadR family transcriptional regulator